VQIDDGSFGRDISDIHLYLCRNDKISDCCCTLDMKNGMISPWEHLSFLGGTVFCGETIRIVPLILDKNSLMLNIS
jgi:hypothetical protein